MISTKELQHHTIGGQAYGKLKRIRNGTERIIKQLEQGTIPWQKPWTGVRSGAFNRVSKKPYSLINQAILEKSGEYATFHQWKNLGGHIKKGAKSEIVVFFSEPLKSPSIPVITERKLE